jgi:hypothetical protein
MKYIKINEKRINLDNIVYFIKNNFKRKISEEITLDIYTVDFYGTNQDRISVEFNTPDSREDFLKIIDSELHMRNFS